MHIWSTNEYVVSMDRINRILPFILHQIAFDRFAFLNNTTKSVRIEQAPKTLFACLVASREGGRDQRSSIAYRTSVFKSEKKRLVRHEENKFNCSFSLYLYGKYMRKQRKAFLLNPKRGSLLSFTYGF